MKKLQLLLTLASMSVMMEGAVASPIVFTTAAYGSTARAETGPNGVLVEDEILEKPIVGTTTDSRSAAVPVANVSASTSAELTLGTDSISGSVNLNVAALFPNAGYVAADAFASVFTRFTLSEGGYYSAAIAEVSDLPFSTWGTISLLDELGTAVFSTESTASGYLAAGTYEFSIDMGSSLYHENVPSFSSRAIVPTSGTSAFSFSFGVTAAPNQVPDAGGTAGLLALSLAGVVALARRRGLPNSRL